MFTGLIEDLGTVRRLLQQPDNCRLTVATRIPAAELVIGESIAVNGICLTVVEIAEGGFSADVSAETVRRTSLVELRTGSRVNLERALRLSDRLGGHLVSGHVDTVATVVSRRQEGNAIHFSFNLDPSYHKYLAEKGSVTIDGISLTVSSLTSEGFNVTIIPHTLAETSLQFCQPGSRVNIETDLLSKYLERLLQAGGTGENQSGLSLDFLAKHGFM